MKNQSCRRQHRRSWILEILIKQILDPWEFREKDTTDDKRKEERDKMGAVNTKCP